MSARVFGTRLCRNVASEKLALGRPSQRVHSRPQRNRAHLSVCSSAVAPVELAVEKSSASCTALCPICLATEFVLEPGRIVPSSLKCGRCNRSFDSTSDFHDLTLSSGVRDADYTVQTELLTSTFQNPWVGFVYERGWRQSFRSAGFPGPDREFEVAMEYLTPVQGEAVMDLSCGSGLFTRRFLASGAFNKVVAVDYSEAMLTQTKQFIKRMESTPEAALHLIRADVTRLPFPTGSFKAIFAGAAIHCWPNAALALAEISRVLSSGGVFVFSTFTQLPENIDELLDSPSLQPLRSFIPRRRSRTINFWNVTSLKDTCRLVGLENFETVRNRRYIMVRVNKPPVNESEIAKQNRRLPFDTNNGIDSNPV